MAGLDRMLVYTGSVKGSGEVLGTVASEFNCVSALKYQIFIIFEIE